VEFRCRTSSTRNTAVVFAAAAAGNSAVASSEVLQNLPPVLFTLLKSTEPWSDEYYSFDLEEALQKGDFDHVESSQPDKRNRTVFGIAT
jgi:hypothetical protein